MRALAAVLGVLFLTFLDTTIVSVTLGDVVADTGAGVIPLQWVVNAYALVFASLMLLGGALADRYGRRRLMLGGLVVFAAGSLVCALAPSVGWIIAGRAVMGLGAAAAEPGTLSIIRQLFPDRAARARALGAWSAVSGLALAVGPVVGGVLVAVGSWRWVFWFNLVATVVLLVAVRTAVPESSDPRPGRLDVGGAALGALGLGAVIGAAVTGEFRGYGSGLVVALFVIGGACLVGFVAVERRVRTPVLDLALVRRPIVSSALFSAFAVYFGVFAIFFLTALYLDIGREYSGGALAAVFAPMAVAIVVGGLVAGRWVARTGTRWPTVTGCALAALGMLLGRAELGRGADLSSVLLALALALAGLGFGVTVVPLTSAVLTSVPGERSGMAASATNTARQLGAVVGVAALGAVVNAHLRDGVDRFLGGGGLGAGLQQRVLTALETGGHGGVDLDALPSFVKQPFVGVFLDGLQWALLVAVALVVLAGVAAALVREPAQVTSTGATADGSAPPSTASTGSA